MKPKIKRVFLSVSFWLLTILLGSGVLYKFGFIWFLLVIVVGIIFKIIVEVKVAKTIEEKTADFILQYLVGGFTNNLMNQFDVTLRSHISWKDKDNYIRIKYHYNMENERDRFIELKEGEGCMGKTFKKAKENYETTGIYADLKKVRESHISDWDMPISMQKLVIKELKWVYCTPIFAMDKELRLIGLFTIDSTYSIEPEFLLPRLEKQIRTIVSIFGLFLPVLRNMKEFYI